MKYTLSIDIGASSGRHIISYFKHGKIVQKEVYRFENKMIEEDGSFYWDIDQLYIQILNGLRACKQQNLVPYSIGIDTWAVDYVLLDKNKNVIQKPFAYRDLRTQHVLRDIFSKIDPKNIYFKTGIQHQNFNTLFQLKSESDKVKENAHHFLMIPDYFNFKLSHQIKNEYTNFSTTQLLDVKTKSIDESLIKETGFKTSIFPEMVEPGTFIGKLKPELVEELGFDASIIAVASHDTASAFLSRRIKKAIVLSSGTWSLIGIITPKAIINEQSYAANFTNEGGYQNEYRFLKNIMGLWIIQEVSRNLDYQHSYETLAKLANESDYDEIFDVNDDCFLKPENMVETIKSYFDKRCITSPQSISDISRCVFRSLAYSYHQAIKEIELLTHETYDVINIVGGGGKNRFLNDTIEKITGKQIVIGPIEATALGNAAVQMIHHKELNNLEEYRELIKEIE